MFIWFSAIVEYSHAVVVIVSNNSNEILIFSPHFKMLQEFIDDGKGHVAGIRSVTVNWAKDETGRWKMDEVPDSEKVV
jgi:NADPH-dependent glutamate synthase beta subunit-like oxidoreductase